MPYNPITLEYHEDDQGQTLMERDEQAKVSLLKTRTKILG